ncbi:cupin domain-containing protein [Methylocystis parvus]|nr:cupin domain-containing protein [Methylocystis parvus]WBK01922.1 cupin domain-containing protein [Methylocystis parvus OBBP]
MSKLSHMAIGACALVALAEAFEFSLPGAAETSDGFIRLLPEQAPFKSPLGAGPSQAVIYGDPSKPGIYVVRNRFPPGAHSNPHFHSQDRHATVIKGVWYTGVGEKIDFDSAIPLKEGSYMLHPANAVHWDGAGAEEVVVQIIGVGPVTTTPAGAPGPQDGHWPKPK